MHIERYRTCETAFLTEITRTIEIILRKNLDATAEYPEQLLNDLVFGISAHLSGSAFGGRVGESEIYPMLSYVIGEGDGASEATGPSAMHEIAGSVVQQVIGDR